MKSFKRRSITIALGNNENAIVFEEEGENDTVDDDDIQDNDEKINGNVISTFNTGSSEAD